MSSESCKSIGKIHDEVQLPQELVDDILEILGAQSSAESRETLARSLLVSRSFYVSARRVLFAKITTREQVFLSGRKETEKMDALLEILEKDLLRDVDPLVVHVRSLRVSMFSVSRISSLDTFNPREWNTQRATLPRVLDMLPNLQTFGLEFITSMDWNAIYAQGYFGIARILKSSHLTTLYLSNIYHFPALILGQCVNLRDLHLENISSRESEGDEDDPGPFRAMDKSLTLWNPKGLQNLENIESKSSSDFFRRIIVAKRHTPLAAPFSRLKSFTIHISNENLEKECETMRCAAASLKCLAVNGIIPSERHSVFLAPICLSTFSSLRTLILSVNIANYQYQLTRFPSVLDNLTSNTLEPTAVENLVISFQAKPYITLQECLLIFPLDDSSAWSKIDRTLTGHSYGSLKKVHLNFLWRYRGSKPSLPPDSKSQVGVNLQSGSAEDARRTWEKERDETLARLRARVEAALPNLAQSQMLEYSY